MPQGKDRTRIEKVQFKWMLRNVNIIYLGCSVLILLDLSYLSRFWTYGFGIELAFCYTHLAVVEL
jgi:hypothetical protein